MVLKKSKRSVNSGNTFHFGRELRGRKRLAENLNLIVKQSRNVRHTEDEAKIREEAAELVDDGGLSDDHVTPFRWGRADVYSVEYSLKKRKRWLVPEQIKYGISNGELKDSADKVKFTMAERETVRTGEFQIKRYFYPDKDCLGYYDSSLDNGRILPTIKYSFATDLKKKGQLRQQRANDQTNSKPPNVVQKHNVHFRGIQRPNQLGRTRVLDPDSEGTRTRNRRRRQDEEETVDETPETPVVHYEILRTRPLSGHTCLHSKHNMEKRFKKYSWSKYKVEKSLNKTKSLVNSLTWSANETAYSCKKLKEEWEEGDGLGQELAEEEFEKLYADLGEDYSIDDECEEYLIRERTQTAAPSFGDIFETLLAKSTAKSNVNRSKKEKRSPGRQKSPNTAAAFNCNYYGKENVHYIDVNDDNSSDPEHGYATDENTAVDTSVQMPPEVILPTPFTCLVPSDEIMPKNLQFLYNGCYEEGQSVPRRFAVSITDDDTSQEPLQTSVLFEVLDGGHTTKTEGSTTTLSVALRAKNYDSLEAHEIFQEKMVQHVGAVSVEEILVQAKEVLQQPSLEVCDVKGVTKVSKRQKKFGVLENMRRWNVEAFTLYQAYKNQTETLSKKEEMDRIGTLVRSLSEIMGDYEIVTVPPDYCDICFDSIREGGGDAINGIAMKPCFHWFCKGCWQQHVTAKISLGRTTITCPGYKCNIKVDRVTLQWLTTREQYRQLVERDWELVVQGSQTLKWCPNGKCGKIVSACVRVSRDNRLGPCIECDCGHTWCFSCQQEPHFPCTCEQAQVYKKLLKQNGDDGMLGGAHVYFAKVKKCPSCQLVMEKNGGCPYMACRCGNGFCWECLGKWQDHYIMGRQVCPKGKKGTQVMELSGGQSLSLSVQFYKQSVRHRRSRKKWSRGKSNRIATELARKIKFGKFGNPVTANSGPITVNSGRHLEPADVYKPGFGCEAEISFFEDTHYFTYQVHLILEYCGVVLSCCCKKSRQMAALDASLRLELIVTRIEEILNGQTVVPRNQIIPTVQKLRSEAEASMSTIISAAGRMQRSIFAGRMKSYEEQLNTLKKAMA